MINVGYYCLVASLIEYQLEGDNKNLNISSVKDEILRTVRKSDAALLSLMTAYFDLENILMALDGRDNRFNALASYSKEEVATISEALKSHKSINTKDEDGNDIPNPICLFKFIKKSISFLEDPKNPKEKKEDIASVLLTEYYKEMEASKNRFIREWGESDRTIKNICAAIEARRNGVDISKVVIGKGGVVDGLCTSSASDFGLKGEVDFVDSVLTITEQTDMLKKEKDLDLLRWRIIDELNVKDYFTINFILGYYMKLCMINRWLVLDDAFGREMFDKIVGELTSKKQLPIEE
ncbi:MAG: DUF2764 family protein [Rikenellaceae bacterium]